MRLDHYMKIGNNNIHLAAILYNLMVIGILIVVIVAVLATSLKRDLANVELLSIRKIEKRDERRR